MESGELMRPMSSENNTGSFWTSSFFIYLCGNNTIHDMKNSLSARLTYRIMAVVLVMMAVITCLVYFTVRESMLTEAQGRYLNVLRRVQGESRRISTMVDMATLNNAHDIEEDLDDPEKMFGHVERIVSLSDNIVCCYLLFEPNYYPDKGRLFIPCARRGSDDSVRVSLIDDAYHSYFSDVWFQEQIKKDRQDWTKPYIESKFFAGNDEPRVLKTVAVPVHNREGRPVALLCSDLSLEDLRDGIMKELERAHQMYEKGCSRHSFSISFSYDGVYLTHPDKQRIVNNNFVEEVKETPDTLDDHVLADMMKNQEGSAMINIDGVPSWIYYQNVKTRRMIAAIVVPEEVIFHSGRRLNAIILLLMLLGMIALYFICRHQIRKTTTPLQHFADAVDQMALGKFSTPLPEIKTHDEVRLLHDAFANMQTSLTIYIDELQKTTAQNALLERDLKIAHNIQMAMLPKTMESNPSIDLFASLTPAREVGGDLYDYFMHSGSLVFCIGDVSGKGVPAALLMAVMRAMFRSEARRANSAADIVETMNRNLCEEYNGGDFVTMFVGILNLASGHLDYCNAGHEAPLLTGQRLPVKPNLPLGALADWTYEGQQAQLQPGDMLFLYTDGLSEAKNTTEEQFGRKHVLHLVSEHAKDSAQQLVELMVGEVGRHAGDIPQSDDITLLAIKWLGYQLKLKASMDDISQLEPFVRNAAGKAGLEDKEAKRLRLAVEETVANIINHGQATSIMLQATEEDNQLVLTIDDDGQPFDPTVGSPTDLSIPPDQRPPGGLGIMLLHEMTDGLNYQRIDGHNLLRIIKFRN